MRKRHIDKPTPAAAPPPPADPTAAIFTIAEVAARWRVSRHTVAAAIRAGRLQAFKPDQRVYRIREDEVVRYERQHMAPTAVAS